MPHSRPYEIFCRLASLPSSSSSSTTFFFLLPPPALSVPLVGWLDSRVGNDEVGVGACDGVAEPGVEDSYNRAGQYAVHSTLQPAFWQPIPATYPQKACRTAAEYPVCIIDRSFAPCSCSRSACCSRGCCAFDIVVETFDDVAGAGLFEVGRLAAQDAFFELELHVKVSAKSTLSPSLRIDLPDCCQ